MNKNLFNSFEINLLRDWPWEKWKNFRLAFGVSGGADSVALIRGFLELISKLNQIQEKNISKKEFEKLLTDQNEYQTDSFFRPYFSPTSSKQFLTNNQNNDIDWESNLDFQYSLKNILVIHINHQLRNIESDQDANFVRELAEKFNISFIERKIERKELQRETQALGSLEAAARLLRYRHLVSAAEDFGARFLLTAHSLNDQLETILQRMFRGTGIEGLTGIQRIRPLNEAIVLVRPLLNISRNEIIEYLNHLNQDFRTDSSNRELCFTRNQIRLELIPLLEKIFPDRWEKSLQRFQQQASEIERQILNPPIEQLKEKFDFFQNHSNFLTIDLKLLNEPEYILQEFFKECWKRQKWPLREMGYAQWKRLTQMAIYRSPCSAEFPGGIVAQIIENCLILKPKSQFHSQADFNGDLSFQ